VDSTRAIYLDYALISSRLLDEKYFDAVAEAVKKKNPEAFGDICRKAEIPENMIHGLWNAALAADVGDVTRW
jgi:hypothetical protein